MRQFLEKMGRIAFFRSGNEPIVLNDQQREARKAGISRLNHYFLCLMLWNFKAFIRQLYENKGINNRFPQTIPDLGAINSGKNENENEQNAEQQSLMMRDKECVICMDHQRGNPFDFD